MQFLIHLGRLRPVVRRPRFFFCRRANESELLDSRDIIRIGPMQVRTRKFSFVQLDQDVELARFPKKKIVFLFGTVTPKNVFRLSQLRH